MLGESLRTRGHLQQQQGSRADMESAPTVQGSMLVIDPEMSDAARLLWASNQARKASLCFAERRQLLRLLVSEKIKAEGLCQLLEYRTPRALPGGRGGARLRVQPEVRQQEQRLAQGARVRRVDAAVRCPLPDHRLQIQGDGLFQQIV